MRDRRRLEGGDSWQGSVSGQMDTEPKEGSHLRAPHSCSRRITSAEDKWEGVSSGWTRGSAVAAAVAVEVFLLLAFGDEPLSWGWNATGAMFGEFSFATNSSWGSRLSLVAKNETETEDEGEDGSGAL